MRFRITHLLSLTFLVALFAFTLSHPTFVVSSWMQIIGWLFYALLAVRAVVKPGRERLVVVSGLILGLSYLAVSYWHQHVLPISNLLQESLFNREGKFNADDSFYFTSIADICISIVATILGAFVGAYWTRMQAKGENRLIGAD